MDIISRKEILQHVDHTLLAPTATWEELQILCDEAIKYETASVCVPPNRVKAGQRLPLRAYGSLYGCRISEWLSHNGGQSDGNRRSIGSWCR